MVRDDHTIMSELFYADNAITKVEPHTSDVRHISGGNVTGWLVQYDPHQKPLDDVMESLTRIDEVLRITQLTPGRLFVIRKPPFDLPLTVLEPQRPPVTNTRERARRRA